VPLVILALLPWLLLAVNRDWIYSDVGLIDPWFYQGYFHSFPSFVSTLFPHTYYGTRLAWILPGFAAYHLLPAHAANLVLHLGFFYAAIAALYRSAAILNSRPAALIGTTAFAVSLPTIVAFGWDYVDGAVITYTAISIWAVVEASVRARRSLLLAVSGITAACIVHSNLTGVFIGPAIAVAYLCTQSQKRWLDLAVFAGGGLLITAALGAINRAVGGPFLFFMPSLQWATASIGTQTFIPVPPLLWPGSARFIMPATGLAAAIGAYANRRTAATRTALFMFVSVVGVYAAYDWAFSAAMLQTQYYVSWFLPFAVFGIAAGLGRARMSATASAVISAGMAAALTSELAGIPNRLHVEARSLIGARLELMEISVALAALVVIAIVCWRRQRIVQVTLVAFALVVADFVVVPNLTFGSSLQGRRQFDVVQQALAFIHDNVPPDKRPIFWIASHSRKGAFYISLASTHLYLYSLYSSVYPKLLDDTGKSPKPGTAVEPGDYVLVAADSPADPQMADSEFQRINLRATVLKSTIVQADGFSCALTLLKIGRD